MLFGCLTSVLLSRVTRKVAIGVAYSTSSDLRGGKKQVRVARQHCTYIPPRVYNTTLTLHPRWWHYAAPRLPLTTIVASIAVTHSSGSSPISYSQSDVFGLLSSLIIFKGAHSVGVLLCWGLEKPCPQPIRISSDKLGLPFREAARLVSPACRWAPCRAVQRGPRGGRAAGLSLDPMQVGSGRSFRH